MLDLQRVKQHTEVQSSIPSLPSLSFNRFNNTLGSIGAQLNPGDVLGNGIPDIDNGDYHQNDIIGYVDPDPDVQSALPLCSAQRYGFGIHQLYSYQHCAHEASGGQRTRSALANDELVSKYLSSIHGKLISRFRCCNSADVDCS